MFGKVEKNFRKPKNKDGTPVTKRNGNPLKIERWRVLFAFVNADGVWVEEKSHHVVKKELGEKLLDELKAKRRETVRLEQENAAPAQIGHQDMTLRDYAEKIYIPQHLLRMTTVDGMEVPALKSGKNVVGYVYKAIEYFKDDKLSSIQRPKLFEYRKYIEKLLIPKLEVSDKVVDGKKEKKTVMVERSKKSTDDHLGRLEFLFNSAVKDKVISEAPSFEKVRISPSEFNSRKAVVEPFEHMNLLASCDMKIYPKSSRRETYGYMKPILIGLSELGCRPESELHPTRRSDIHIDPAYPGIANETAESVRGYVRITEGKIQPGEMQTYRETPITLELMRWIEEDEIMALPPDTLVFGQHADHDSAWKSLKKLAGITRKLGLGAYRHTAFSNAALANVPREVYQGWYGHTTLSLVTEGYVHLTPEFHQQKNRIVEMYKLTKQKEAIEQELRRLQELEPKTLAASSEFSRNTNKNT